MTVLLYQQDDRGVAHVTLDRPDVHNAFNEELIAALTDAFADIATSSRVRVVVLQSNGASFCAGADLDWMRRAAHYDDAHNLRDATALMTMLDTIDRCPKPVIAAVQGPAYGGGVGLAACADIAIATERAAFRLSEVKLGLIPATISPFVLQAIGARQARRYFLTAESFSAEDAHRFGLVHEVVYDEAALKQRVETLVETLLANAPGAITEAKALVRDFAGRAISPELQADASQRIAHRRASAEGKEGIAAFLGKRPPDWMTHA